MKKDTKTIMMFEVLADRVDDHVKKPDTKTDFYNRAIINQLENEGDWAIRDIIEKALEEDGDN
jgi:hypothetical protein